MTASLPHDTLREIGKYWAGHRLLYTCTVLYTSWNPDDHVITERMGPLRYNAHTYESTITIKRMPNGVHHGKCAATRTKNGRDPLTEIIEYNRGELISVTYYSPSYCRAMLIIDGCVCSWKSDHELTSTDNINDVTGRVSAIISSTLNSVITLKDVVAYRDFAAVARDLVIREAIPGGYHAACLMLDWGRPMPGTWY